MCSIAKHKRLGPALKTLRFGTHYLEDDSATDYFSEELLDAETDDERLEVTKLKNRFYEYLDAQALFRHGDDVAMLSTVLSHLTKVEEIEIGEWGRDSSDGDAARCYGLTTAEAETSRLYLPGGPAGYRYDPGRNGLDQNFQAVLRALALNRKPV